MMVVALCWVAIPGRAASSGGWRSMGPDGGSVVSLTVDPMTPSIIYAVGDRYTCSDSQVCWPVHRSDDGGLSWRRLPFPAGFRVVELVADPLVAGRLFAATTGGIFRSTDGGDSWSHGGLADRWVTFVRIEPGSTSVLYAASYNQGVADARFYRSSDAGASWQNITGDLAGWYINHLAIDPVNPSTMYVRHDHEIFKSIDGGESWFFIRDFSQSIDIEVDPVTPSTIYISNVGDGVLKSIDGGVSWTPVNTGLGNGGHLLHVHPAAPEHLYATDGETLFASTDGGAGWSTRGTGPIREEIQAIALDPVDLEVVYAGVDAGVFVSADGGTSWSARNEGIHNAIVRSIALDPLQTGTVYAAASRVGFEHRFGGLVKSIDGGTNWQSLGNVFPSFAAFDIVLDPTVQGTLYVAVAYHGIWKSTDAGVGWTLHQNGLLGFGDDLQLTSLVVDPTSPNTLFLGSKRYTGFVYRSTNGGVDWSQTIERRTHSLTFDPGSGSLVAGTSGGPWRSTDGGDTWVDIDPNHGPAAYAVVVDPSEPDTIFFGGQYDWVWKTTDGGVDWQLLRIGLDGTRVTSLVIDPADPDRLYAASWGGGVATSADEGATWNPVNQGLDASRVFQVAIDPADPRVLWAATERGGVIRIDQDVVFSDDFESGDLSAWVP